MATITIFSLFLTIVLLIVGIIFLFLKNGKATKVFKTSGIAFSVFIISLILSGDNGFWYTAFILAFLVTLILLIVGTVFLFLKNGKAKKVFKTSGIAFLVFIVSVSFTVVFTDADDNSPHKELDTDAPSVNTEDNNTVRETVPEDQPINSPANSNDGLSPYSKEELEADPNAPSTNSEDYNTNGEYVPENGPTDNPEDYNGNGEYKPVDDMTKEEMQVELEKMIEDSLRQ